MENPRLQALSEWLIEKPILEIQKKISDNELTSYELVLIYLNRIRQYDKDGPKINSILEINPDALAIAASLDEERKIKGTRGPLHGIPVIIKDNIDTKDKMHTSAGSLPLKDSYAKKDSHVAKCLREAGAIILGKANMTEWANFMTYNMPNGYSSRGGQVLNPYGKDLDVGGSSSGSGASVSANFVTIGIGTETSGSILSPSSQNSLVGIKPTVGLVSRTGIIPISHSQDTAGPMARCVEDAAILLSVLSSVDEEDPITKTNPNENLDYSKFLDKSGIKGAKIGVCREGYFNHLDDEKKEIMNQAVEQLKSLGGIVKDTLIPSSKTKWNIDVLLYEFKNDLNAYLSKLDYSIKTRTLGDIIKYNIDHQKTMLKYGQSILLESEKTSGTLTDKAYLKALEKDIYLSREAGIDKVMDDEKLDVLVFPNNFGASIPAKAGYPSITVPAGYTKEGEPVGITFTGKAFSEATLIKIAYAYEQATLNRVPPKL